jgi:hypothetical protein
MEGRQRASLARGGLGHGSRLGGEEVHKAVDLVVVLAEGTNDNGGDSA